MSMVLVSVCLMVMLMFVISFTTIKNPTSEILSSKYGLNASKNNLDANLNSFSTVSDKAKTMFVDAQPKPLDYVFLIFLGAMLIPQEIFKFIVGGATTIINVLFGTLGTLGNVAGVGNLFIAMFGVIFAGIVLTGVLLFIKFIRSGDSER